jgi:hypothetical protein
MFETVIEFLNMVEMNVMAQSVKTVMKIGSSRRQ